MIVTFIIINIIYFYLYIRLYNKISSYEDRLRLIQKNINVQDTRVDILSSGVNLLNKQINKK